MSQIKAVLFDLDGTLLPMDQDEFTNGYFKLLTAKAAPRGYEPKALADAVWAGTAAMVRNDGSKSNEDAFWAEFARIYGPDALADKELFDAFYADEFTQAQALCGYAPGAADSVYRAKELGFRVALATNPIFPRSATLHRISWAGLQPADFELFTCYENSSLCKPNPAYFADVAARMGLGPEECLMVGNDATEDMAAREVGMDVFLLTDCLINAKKRDLNAYPRGDFAALNAYIDALQ